MVPEFNFNVEPVNDFLDDLENMSTQNTSESSPDKEINKISVNESLILAEQKEAEALIVQKKLIEEKRQQTLVIIIAANLVIIVIALVVFFSLRRKNKAL